KIDDPARMSYYEIPTEVLEKPKQAVVWARRSVEIARKKAKGAKSKSGTRKKASPKIAQLRNLGPQSAKWLAKVGIKDRADLEEHGSIGAFLAVKASGQAASLNLLYALEGALIDESWLDLPGPLKERLRAALK
ncbi:MAG: DNA transformation protein, partial [Candidatus Paceibacteria bacterium]